MPLNLELDRILAGDWRALKEGLDRLQQTVSAQQTTIDQMRGTYQFAAVQLVDDDGTVHNFPLSPRTLVLVGRNTSALTLTGFASGFDTQLLVVLATDADITLDHNTGSDVGNRIRTPTGSGVTKAADAGALLVYDAATTSDGVWRLIV